MMRKYLIIAIAILAAFLVLGMLARLYPQRTEGGFVLQNRHIIAALVGLIVFIGAAILLDIGADDSSTVYRPAYSENGIVQPGQFIPK